MKISHWPRLLAAPLILAAVLLTGCAGGGPTATSWPGITVADQDIYLAYHKIYAVDSDGKLKWFWPPTLTSGQAFYAPPVVSEDMVVVTDYADSVHALNRETGERQWQFQTQGKQVLGLFHSKGPRFVGGAAIGEKYIYAASDDGVLHALNKDDGTEAKNFKAAASIWATPLVDGDTVYVVSLDRHVYALDAETLELRWKFPENPEDAGDPPMGPIVGKPTLHDGVLYFGSFNNHVYALDTTTRQVLWTKQTSNWVWSSPVFDEESKLLIGADMDGHVFALNPEDGTGVWEYTAHGPEGIKVPIVGPPLLTTREDDTRAAMITVGGAPNLVVLDTADGLPAINSDGIKVLFVSDILGIETSRNERVVPMYAPPTALDNKVLIGANEGKVQIYALDSESLDRVWEFDSLKAEEDKKKAETDPAEQGPFGSNSTLFQYLPFAALAVLVVYMLSQRRGSGGGK